MLAIDPIHVFYVRTSGQEPSDNELHRHIHGNFHRLRRNGDMHINFSSTAHSARVRLQVAVSVCVGTSETYERGTVGPDADTHVSSFFQFDSIEANCASPLQLHQFFVTPTHKQLPED